MLSRTILLPALFAPLCLALGTPISVGDGCKPGDFLESVHTVPVAFSSNDDMHKTLPTYDEATGLFFEETPEPLRREILDAMHAVIDKHSMNNFVGVDIKHKHNDMAPEQRLVETPDIEGKTSIMRPEKASDAVPFAFALREQWLPYEFVKNCDVARDRLHSVASNTVFMTEIAEVIARYGMQEVLGVHILHRDHLSGEPMGMVETAGEADGELLLRPYTKELKEQFNENGTKVRQVMWTWTQGMPTEDGVCGAHCSHCSHCGKCIS